jgi:Domain of unknown function (DUF1707)
MGMSRGEAGRAAVLDDARRDACLHSLGDHYAAGRLSADELDARVQFALAAETDEDLASVMQGLDVEPAADEEAQPEAAQDAGPGWPARVLRFLTHWAFTTRWARKPRTDPPAAIAVEEDVPDQPSPPEPPHMADQADAGPVEPSAPARPDGTGPVPRRVRINGGVIPTQRRND